MSSWREATALQSNGANGRTWGGAGPKGKRAKSEMGHLSGGMSKLLLYYALPIPFR